MPANPEILNKLKQYVTDKTGGNPPTGGDKDKGKGAPIATKSPERIPLPDYNNPQSRLAYAHAFRQKYGDFAQGRGDTPLRINEIPDTQTDTLNSKQLALKAAKIANLPPALLYSSAMEEGMSGIYNQKGTADYSGNEKFPVDGYVNFGLDTFSDAFPGLVKKGYLPADFKNQFVKKVAPARKGDNKIPVNSADFASADAALQAKAAMLRATQDELDAYTTKNKIPLSPKAKQFFTLLSYNAGSGNAQKMMQDYQKAGALTNDAFLESRPIKGGTLSEKSWATPYQNTIVRMKMADALNKEGYFDEPTPAQQPIVTK